MSMVKQTRYVFDLSTIESIRLVCNYRDADTEQSCDGEAVYPLGKRKGWEWVCPKCGEAWKTEFTSNMPPEIRIVSQPEAASLNLLDSVEILQDSACAPFSICFEIDGESDENA